MQVSLRAKVDLPPDDVYEILIAPDNRAVFKGIKVTSCPCYAIIEATAEVKSKSHTLLCMCQTDVPDLC